MPTTMDCGLTTDCSEANKNGLGRFRTEANNPNKQVCYFNGENNDQIFNVFMSTRINKQEAEKDIYYLIDRVRSNTNEGTFEANTLLRHNGGSNDSSKKFGSVYRPSENRYGHDNDVQISKRRKTNRKLAKPRFLSGRQRR